MPSPKSLKQKATTSKAKTATRRPCRICHNLDPRGHPQSVYQSEDSQSAGTSLTLIVDGSELQRSQESGCRFCDVITQALDGFWNGWKGRRIRVVLDLVEKAPLRITLEGVRETVIELSASSAKRAPWPTLGRAHPIPPNAGSDQTFDFARRCIQDCLTGSNHANCRVSSSKTIAPKRLLDVGRVNQPIRIVDTQGKKFQYATLSHCWGTGPTLATTKANWQKMSGNIPFEALPALFQDAVIIARQLGLHYIWIDSLCIIQDSTRDWESESAKMGGIYEGSYVTIAASACGDSATRCLVDREKPLKLVYQNSRKEEFAIRARKLQDHHPDPAQERPARPFGPLTTRAWALQEHVLSTRILHYTSTELLFECRSSFRCECTRPRKPTPTTLSLIPKALSRMSKDEGVAVWEAWQHIVSQYSTRNLTVPSDKLVAIAGIASKIHSVTSSRYLGGLWLANLASDLLWSTDSTAKFLETTTALDPYRAPSFSWASIKAPVKYYEPDEDERAAFKSHIEILEAGCKPTGTNPLGTITDGLITLKGPVLDAILVSSDNSGLGTTYQALIRGTSAIQITPDCLLAESEKSVRRAKFGETYAPFKATVFCLGVASYDSWISGLVLGFSERRGGAYERLGTFAAGRECFQKAETKTIRLV